MSGVIVSKAFQMPEPTATYKNECVNGHCSNCGGCCTDMLPLSIKELKRIKTYAREHHLKENFHVSVLAADSVLDFTCPFRNDFSHKCEIYEVRPEICKTFVCSMSIDKAKQNRNKIHRGRKEYCLRWEVFGNSTLLDYFEAIGFLQSGQSKKLGGHYFKDKRKVVR